MSADCRDVDVESLVELLAGRLSPARREALDRHVDRCSACRQLLGNLARVEGATGGTDPTERALPPGAPMEASVERPALPPRTERYGDLRRLARGGMGVVWQAIRVGDGQRVALKTLTRLDPRARRRFAAEAAAIQEIDDPHVVRVLDVGETADGVPYLVMEWLEGEDLGERLRNGALEPIAAARIAIAAARGLAAAHDRGIVHRDVKPSNLFLPTGGGVKVLDFGLALVPEALRGERETTGLAVLGTPSFMAPEQVQADRTEDPRTDVWGLGATLYRAVAGRPPFQAESVGAELVRIAVDEPDPLPPGVPPWLADIVGRALRRQPADRFASARAFGLALEAALEGTPEPPADSRADRVSLTEEVRLVTVLWAELLERRAELERMIESSDGLVSARDGDALVALFGSERWEGDEPERALRVASTARERALAGRLGVATGRAVQGARARVSSETLDRARSVASPSGVGVDGATRGWLDGRVAGVPFVGREAEMALLRTALQRAVKGRSGSGWLLVGPAGIGKTRLVDELVSASEASSGPLEVVRAAASQHRQMEGWHAFRGAVRRTLALGPGDTGERIFASAPSVSCAEGLAELVGVGVAESPRLLHARAHVQHMQDFVTTAVGDWLGALAATRPLLVVVEDVHWADRLSLALLDILLRRLEGAPVVLVATARTAPDDLLAEFRRVEIGALPRDATRTIVAALLGDDAPGDEIHVHAGGNAHLAIELALSRREGITELPASAEGAARARLDVLPAAAKDLVRRASVLSQPFTLDDLRDLGADSPEKDLVEPLRRELLVTDVAGGPVRRAWRFRHELIREVAYGSLTEAQRRSLHLGAAAGMAARSDPPHAERARHLELGGNDDAAVAAWRDALAHAQSRADGEAVLAASERLLARGLPAGDELRVRDARYEALMFASRTEEAAAEVEAMSSGARTSAERAHAAERAAWLASRRARYDQCLAHVEAALALAPEGRFEAWIVRTNAMLHLGRITQAAEDADRALAEATGPLDEGRALALRGLIGLTVGHHGRASRDLAQALARFEALGDSRRLASTALKMGAAALWAGDLPKARAELERARDTARAVGYHGEATAARSNLGLVALREGRVDLAVSEQQAALEEARRAGTWRRLSLYCTKALAWTFVCAGRLEEARVALDDAKAQLEPGGVECELAVIEARLALREGRVAEAAAAARRGLALRSAQGGMEELESELFLAAHEAGIDGALEQGLASVLGRAATIDDPVVRATFLGLPENRSLGAR